jgi:Flp pilus assembly protein TadB
VAGYGLKLGGALIALLLIGVILVLIFNALWFRIGLGAAFVLVFGVIVLIAWNTDRKNKAKRAGLPPV